MRKTNAAIVLLILIAGFLLWHFRPENERKVLEEGSSLQSPTIEKVTPNRPQKQIGSNQSDKAQILFKERQSQRERDTEEVNNEWRTPIDFYGKVVDQTGNPVEGAKVLFGWNNLSGSPNREVTSGASGLFDLRGEQGKVLTVRVSKDGYYTEKDYPVGFFYAGQNENFAPDPNNPVVFRLYKKGIAEPLICSEFPGFAKIAQLRRDGDPVSLDLMTGTKTAEGHLKLEFWGDPIERTTRRFTWKCRLSVRNGGIQETDEKFHFQAPEDGYHSFVEIDMPASAEKWQNELRRTFFIQLPDEKYGRIDFYLLTRNGVFTVNSCINPSGSRNLEFDPEVQPKQTHFE